MENLLYIVWGVNPDIISSPITIRWYGVLFASAFLLGYYVLKRIFFREGLSEDLLDKVLMYVMVGTVLGARLGHVFFYDWAYYSQNIGEILQIWKGGLASHGAAIGIITALYIFSKYVSKKPLLWILDRVVITIALGAFFIRIGNLMNHEIIGIPTSVPWAFIFTLEDELPRHPTQLYEAFGYLLLFVGLYLAYFKTNISTLSGRLFGWFLVVQFTIRFFVEFLKENQVAFENNMTLNMGQWLSLPLIGVGLYFAFRPTKKLHHDSQKM